MRAKKTAAAMVAILAISGLSACGREAPAASGSGTCSAGITDSEIRIGSSMPSSGPAAAYGAVNVATAAYFEDINKDGGVKMGDGKTRKVVFTATDDGYDPARTVGNVRKLVEETKVAALMNVLGTSPNAAIEDYVTTKKIPNLFAMTGTDALGEQESPYWLQGFMPEYKFETSAIGKQVTDIKSDAKVAILYQNDGYGENMLADFKAYFKDTDVTIVGEQSYEKGASSIDSQIVNLSKSGADVFLNYSTGAYMTQSLRKRYELGWDIPTIISSTAVSAAAIMDPAGTAATNGVMSSTWLKDVSTDRPDDKGLQAWYTFATEHDIEKKDSLAANGYTTGQLMVKVLENTKGCTTDDIRAAASELKDVTADLLIDGLAISTTADYPYVLSSVGIMTFKDGAWTVEKTIEREK